MFSVVPMLIVGESLSLYTQLKRIGISDDLSRYLYTLDKTCVRTKTDQTLEVIMTELDREKMKIFYQEYTNSAAEATKVSESNER